MKYLLFFALLFTFSFGLRAQLTVKNDRHPEVLPLSFTAWNGVHQGGAAGAMSGRKSKVEREQLFGYSEAFPRVDQPGFSLLNRLYPAPIGYAQGPPATAPKPFDFTQTAPHLAFFCRLEINEAAGFIIPAKFRLGGHRYWQDDLLRH